MSHSCTIDRLTRITDYKGTMARASLNKPAPRAAAAKPAVRGELARQAFQLLKTREQHMVHDLQQLVEFESPSSNKPAVDVLGTRLRKDFERLGAKVTMHPAKAFGDHLL